MRFLIDLAEEQSGTGMCASPDETYRIWRGRCGGFAENPYPRNRRFLEGYKRTPSKGEILFRSYRTVSFWYGRRVELTERSGKGTTRKRAPADAKLVPLRVTQPRLIFMCTSRPPLPPPILLTYPFVSFTFLLRVFVSVCLGTCVHHMDNDHGWIPQESIVFFSLGERKKCHSTLTPQADSYYPASGFVLPRNRVCITPQVRTRYHASGFVCRSSGGSARPPCDDRMG